VHPSDVYMLGDFLFVAPVVEAGATSRTVMLPPGEWVDWWTGTRYPGERETTLAAPLDTIPLLMMAGTPVPLLRPTIDTLSPVDPDEAIDSLASSHGLLYARVAIGTVGGFTLFDGTRLFQRTEAGKTRLTYTPGDDWFEGAVFEVIGLGTPPAQVLDAAGKPFESAATPEALDALDTGTSWTDAQGGTLIIKLTATSTSAEFTLP
jgi:hypothetical protein